MSKNHEQKQRLTSRMRRLSRLAAPWMQLASAALALVVLVAPLIALPAAAAPRPLNVDVPVLNEGFEGVFQGSVWSAVDTNASSGLDSWDDTDYRAASGASSLWAASNGTQRFSWDAGYIAPVNVTPRVNTTIFHDSFENGSFAANWSANDEYDDPLNSSGNDTWGRSSVRRYDGNTSIWASQVGFNDVYNTTNRNVSMYDNNQWSHVWREIDLSGFKEGTDFTLEFWYWMDVEMWSDYFYPAYFDGSYWNYMDYLSGNNSAWVYASYDVPYWATAVGFAFYSDWQNVYEGVYVDNVTLWAGPEPQDPQPAGQFVDDLEASNAWLNWSSKDEDSYAGRDYWGVSTARAHSGTSSLWSAQFGDNTNYGGSNAAVASYDDGMSTMAWRPVVQTNLSQYTWVEFSFWYWMQTENCCDWFYPVYYTNNSGWNYLNYYSGSSGGWVQDSYLIGTDVTRVGFIFSTDSSVVDEGVYLDDIELQAYRDDENEVLRTYDTDMNATLWRPVTVSEYPLAYLQYSFWMETDSAGDGLESMVYDGSHWTNLERLTGSSSGWQSSKFSIPTNTTRIGFRFVTDSVGHAEGAYLDDIKVWGEVFPVNCTAGVSVLTGMEGTTMFSYSSGGADGLRPYTYHWLFSDGAESTQASPNRFYNALGSFNGTVTITDILGQSCTVRAPEVTVTHDISAIFVSPAVATVVEGQTVSINGSDAKHRPMEMGWTLSPANCGVLSSDFATGVVFTASEQAGGKSCTVSATVGLVRADTSIQVVHDSSVVSLTPSVAELVEGSGFWIQAVDRYGHGLTFGWSATCGVVYPTTGNTTYYTADNEAGQTCTVSATGLMATGRSVITVVQDTHTLVVEPSSASVVAGKSQAFSVVDARARPVIAAWSVSPPDCGNFSDASGSISIFTASIHSGGRVCNVAAAAGQGWRSVEVTVRFDTAQASLSPSAASVVEGGSLSFEVLDTYGNPLVVTWSLDPTTCGAFDTEHASEVTLTVAPAAGGGSCTVNAVAAGVTLQALVTVEHGPATEILASVNATSATAGGKLSVDATVKNAAGYTLRTAPVTWTASCGIFDNLTGKAAVLMVSQDAGASTCYINATSGDLRSMLMVVINRAGPFTLTVRVSGDQAGPQLYEAVVKDGFGATVRDADITWASTCGALSASSGPSTMFTPPGDLGGSSCRVTATSSVGTSTSEFSRTVTTGMSPVLPGGILGAAAALAAAFVLMRKRKHAAAAVAAAETEQAAPAPAPADPYAADYAQSYAQSYPQEGEYPPQQ